MNKRDLSETDIRTKYITPSILEAGWDSKKQVREEVYFTDGRIRVNGSKVRREKGKKADYILYYKKGKKLAVVEAKDNSHSIGSGIQQALSYAEILDVPFVYSSNGDGFVEYDRTQSEGAVERQFSLDEFPGPEELWTRYKKARGLDDTEKEKIVEQPYFFKPGDKEPRYYQEIAVNRTMEAIAHDQKRLMLVMATGTGKTLTAFHIMYRLWKAGANNRILYLADRNILVDDPIRKYFGPMKDKVHKIQRGKVSKAHQIYFALYQAVSGGENFEDIFTEYSPDFFDLIIVDECHRGSAAADSAWRRVLEYFSSATQIGMTATPKETNKVSNTDYFGEPLYIYSLKQGIEDGFLAPYKVIRYTLDRDAEGWRPTQGQKDKYGYEIPDRVYNQKDYDKDMVLQRRTKLVAQKVTEYLQHTDPFAKTIIFCRDIDHAERMRSELVNLNTKYIQRDHRYVMQITGDQPDGVKELDGFMDPEETYPVIATTSKLLTTGVDIPTCKMIVLDTEINSMPEFKQIIGRGTRINEDFGKYYFTIMDFRNVTRLFADPNFDGLPEKVQSLGEYDSPVQEGQTNEGAPEEDDYEAPSEFDEGEWEDPDEEDDDEPPRKLRVDDVDVEVINKRVQYYGEDGKLVTESIQDFSRKNVKRKYRSLDEFLKDWNSAKQKKAIIDELEQNGVLFEDLQQETDKDMDAFDLICHIAFDQPPKSRRERANSVKKENYFDKYSETAQKVLKGLLDKYADEGIKNIESMEVLKLDPFRNYGTPYEIIQEFGGRDAYFNAVSEIENQLYQAV